MGSGKMKKEGSQIQKQLAVENEGQLNNASKNKARQHFEKERVVHNVKYPESLRALNQSLWVW